MLLIAILMSSSQPAPLQIFSSPVFEAFARQTDATCRGRRARFLTAGDLDWEEESFLGSLTPKMRERVAGANMEEKRCAGRDGLSCPATATLEAIAKKRLMKQFSAFVCAHPAPS